MCSVWQIIESYAMNWEEKIQEIFIKKIVIKFWKKTCEKCYTDKFSYS